MARFNQVQPGHRPQHCVAADGPLKAGHDVGDGARVNLLGVGISLQFANADKYGVDCPISHGCGMKLNWPRRKWVVTVGGGLTAVCFVGLSRGRWDQWITLACRGIHCHRGLATRSPGPSRRLKAPEAKAAKLLGRIWRLDQVSSWPAESGVGCNPLERRLRNSVGDERPQP
jgi:hypothetical protein